MYSIWSSRVFVNFVVYIFTDHSIVFWAIFMGISMYILLCALSKLFVEGEKNKHVCNLFITCMVMFFPFGELSSAGWIVTMTTYFAPTAFGLMSLVPIKKIAKGEKINICEMVSYAICLIYGANFEQMMVLILGCYAISLLYFIIKKKCNLYHVFLFILSVGSCIFIMTCPGNANRLLSENKAWFPAYGMLNVIDKAEIGYTTSLRWLVFSGGNVVLCITCVIFAFLLWKKYQDKVIRWITLFPIVITVLFGPLRSVTGQVFFSLDLAKEIPYWGITNSENRGGIDVFVQFMVMSMVILVMYIELFLIVDNFKEFIEYITLFSCGIASRIAMGFSPTIYASGYRTCTVMTCAVIAMCIGIYSKHLRNQSDCEVEVRMAVPGMCIVLVLAMFNLCYTISNAFA